jgi:Na+/phosphate symporter
MVTVGFVIGTFLTSSNATTALALGLVAAGGSSLPAAIAFVAGGNAGATVISIVAARELGMGAIRVAVMHTVVKLLAAYVVAFVAQPFALLVQAMGGDGARQVANAHTVFNVLVALPGTLLAGVAARIAERAMPSRQEETGPRYLDPAVLDEPRWALAVARREVVRISDEVLVMAELTARELRRGLGRRRDPRPRGPHRSAGARRDPLPGRPAGAARARRHLGAAVHLGDRARDRRAPAPPHREAREQAARRGRRLQRAGRAELAAACDALLDRMRNTFTALAVGHKGLARQVVTGRPDYERLIAERRLDHLARLEARLPPPACRTCSTWRSWRCCGRSTPA